MEQTLPLLRLNLPTMCQAWLGTTLKQASLYIALLIETTLIMRASIKNYLTRSTPSYWHACYLLFHLTVAINSAYPASG